MEFIDTAWCSGNWLRLDQTRRDLTCGDLEIPLVAIRVGKTEPKNNKFVCHLDLLGGSGKKGWCDLVYGERP